MTDLERLLVDDVITHSARNSPSRDCGKQRPGLRCTATGMKRPETAMVMNDH